MSAAVRKFYSAVAAIGAVLLLSTAGISAEPQTLDPAKAAPGQVRQQLQPETPQRVTTNKAVAPSQHSQNTDAMIATCLAIGNGEEVALARLAIDKAESDKVREFAETIVKDHTEMLAKLERFGGHAGLGKPAPTEAPRTNVGTEQPQLSRNGQSGFDFLTVKRQIAQQCLASAQKCWQVKKLANAEMAFVGSQIVAHQMMIDSETVLRNYASPELRDLIDKGIETAEAHKKHAEELIEQLGRDTYSKTAQK